MSDYDDDSPYDDEDMSELMEDDPDSLTPEDVFKMVTLNKIKKTKVRVELQDKNGDKVDLPEVIGQIIEYIKDKTAEEEGNQFSDQIMPLMSQAVLSTLGRMLGIRLTAYHLANDSTRMALIWSMCTSFLLLKYVQKHELSINTFEESVSEEEIEAFERKAQANNVAMLGALVGEDPKQILEELLHSGKITEDDLQDIMGDSKKKGNKGED